MPHCQQNRFTRSVPCLLLSIMALAMPVYASGTEPGSRPDIFVGAQYFLWEEFNGADKRLLQESGLRLALGAAKSNLDRRSSGLLYEVQLRSYFGDLIYDGQTQSGTPLETDVAYRGNQLKIAVGGRFRIDTWSFFDMVDLMGGVGIEHWTRDIEDGVTATGVPAAGIKEDYHVRYEEFAAGLMDFRGKASNYFQLGARRPLETREGVAIFDGPVSLSPVGNWSMFARYRLAPVPLFSQHGNAVSVYYESYRFSKSPNVSTAIAGIPQVVWQPKSSMDVLGIQYEVRF